MGRDSLPRASKSRSPYGGRTHAGDSVTKKLEELVITRGPVGRRNVSGTGLVYDERMLKHACKWDPLFPEKPERLTVIIDHLQSIGLLGRTVRIPAREATETELLKCHSQSYINAVVSSREMPTDKLQEFSKQYDSIYFCDDTYSSACLAAGGTIELVRSIVSDHIRNGFALVRPPGHHAMSTEACGYCIWNNIAIAARYALDELAVRKVLIVDLDVHHGQATQATFYDDPRVLYCSIHRYENGAFWPHLKCSNFNYIGVGNAAGFNMNVPLNTIGLGDADYLAVFEHLLMPIAYEFEPELVLVSAGFDAAAGDPKGQMQVTAEGYAHMIHLLSALAQGRIALVLEGGYSLNALPLCAEQCLRILLDDHCPILPSLGQPHKDTVTSILSTAWALRPYWKSLDFYPITGSSKCNVTLPSFKPQLLPLRTDDTTNVVLQQQQSAPTFLSSSAHGTPNRVLVIYDLRMKLHSNANNPNYPERPERIDALLAGLDELRTRCTFKSECRLAERSELTLVHDEHYIDAMEATESMSRRELDSLETNYNSIYFNSSTYNSALLAVGGLLEAVDSVVNDQASSAVAIVRPPGHHAEGDCACGFCIFNSVAIAARYAQQIHGMKRILILDWDVHHGNGTQNAVYEDNGILYCSIHRYDNGTFFPVGAKSNLKYLGEHKGLGYNINIPWSKAKMGDYEYMMAFERVVMPVAYQFAPELVLVSAGFDAAEGDPLGGYTVSPAAYAHMTHMLKALANGRLILALEGGYNLTSISNSLTECVRVLLGDPLPPLSFTRFCHTAALETLRSVVEVLQPHWSALNGQWISLPKHGVDGLKEEELPNTSSDGSQKRAKQSTEAENQGTESLSGKKMQIGGNVASAVHTSSSHLTAFKKQNRVGLIYHEDMLRHKNPWDDGHIERPERLSRIWNAFEKHGLVQRCVRLTPRLATRDDIATMHDRHMIEKFSTFSQLSVEQLEAMAGTYEDVYFCNETFELALMSAGCVLEATNSVLSNAVDCSFAAVRPPGHHACHDQANGFCIFNNVALAANEALNGPYKLQRVLIVDFDVHHGQGVQRLFYDNPKVLYVSIHRYQFGKFWPCLRESDFDAVGSGAGEGFNVNVPLNKTGLKDSDYLFIFQHVILPMSYEFQPECVFICAGYDAAMGCSEGHMRLSPAVYAHMTHSLMSVASGRVCVVLEGGYCLDSLSESAAWTLKALLGDPCPRLDPTVQSMGYVDSTVVETVLSVMHVHSTFWRCMRNEWQMIQTLAGRSGGVMVPSPVVYQGSPPYPGAPPFPTKNCYINAVWPPYKEELDSLLHQYAQQRPVQVCRTGIAYDMDGRMLHHFDQFKDATENPARVDSVYKHLKRSGLLDVCMTIAGREATDDELKLVHTAELIEKVKHFGNDYLHDAREKDPTFTCEKTFLSASVAVGTSLNAVAAVLERKCANAFALVRPPGHHADSRDCGGFCFFNNIAIAAKFAQQKYEVRRILILDLDIHFGNGTCALFEQDPSVLYVSVHRYEDGAYYPNLKEGDFTNVGKGAGTGFTVNVPWPSKGRNDADYEFVFHQLILPVAFEFAPELVLVSAGFDAAHGDKLGECHVSPSMFAYMIHHLSALADGKLLMILEGGYYLEAMKACITASIYAMHGVMPELDRLPEITRDTPTLTADTISTLAPYWRCFSCWTSPGVNAFVPAQGAVQLEILDQEIPTVAFAVQPRSWCPHLAQVHQDAVPTDISTTLPCSVCAHIGENWLCLTCYKLNCSRFVQGHGKAHFEESNHAIALSFADLSVWCYACDCYLDNPVFETAIHAVQKAKFGPHL